MYLTNKLLKVSDAIKGFPDEGFKDGTNTGNDYAYDVNGNMVSDANKGITSITYNHLNLPITVTINGQNISYIYDAVGTKLRKTVNGITTDYSGNYVYETEVQQGSRTPLRQTLKREQNGQLQFFNHAEGYIDAATGTFSYVYQYKDHPSASLRAGLGNIRLSYKNNNGTLQILEENNYYPFGLQHKGYNNVIVGTHHPYTFNGKEEQEELSLNWIDFGFRNYDASLGRWMNLDPHAEAMRRHSPYNYAFDNPVFFIDPDGMLPQSGKQETDATRSQKEQLDKQKRHDKVVKAFNDAVTFLKEEQPKDQSVNEGKGDLDDSNTYNEKSNNNCPICPKNIFDKIFSHTLTYNEVTGGLVVGDSLVSNVVKEFDQSEFEKIILKVAQGAAITSLSTNIKNKKAAIVIGGGTALLNPPNFVYEVEFEISKVTNWFGSITYNILTGEILSVKTDAIKTYLGSTILRITTKGPITTTETFTHDSKVSPIPKVGENVN